MNTAEKNNHIKGLLLAAAVICAPLAANAGSVAYPDGDIVASAQSSKVQINNNYVTASGAFTATINIAKWLASSCTGNTALFSSLSNPVSSYDMQVTSNANYPLSIAFFRANGTGYNLNMGAFASVNKTPGQNSVDIVGTDGVAEIKEVATGAVLARCAGDVDVHLVVSKK